jgi:hypothetical protein
VPITCTAWKAAGSTSPKRLYFWSAGQKGHTGGAVHGFAFGFISLYARFFLKTPTHAAHQTKVFGTPHQQKQNMLSASAVGKRGRTALELLLICWRVFQE